MREIRPAERSTDRSGPFLLALMKKRGTGRKKALSFAMHSNWSVRNSAASPAQAEIESAAEEIHVWEATGIHTVGFFDDDYPPLLRSLADPPPVLWIRGDIRALHHRAVAIVGTRGPSRFGIQAAEAVATAAVNAKWCVVSGLARGIDTVAHQTAVAAKGLTVAVLAGGLDDIYPAENRSLANQIVHHRGALVSESPPGVRPRSSSFVDRDRIQSALARAVFICQTGKAGGTLHTARFAVQQGRPIFCPVPSTREEKNEGLEALLRVPGRRLPSLFKEWSTSRWAPGQLGDRPVARGFNRSTLGQLVDWLDESEHFSPEEASSSPVVLPPQRELLELLGSGELG